MNPNKGLIKGEKYKHSYWQVMHRTKRGIKVVSRVFHEMEEQTPSEVAMCFQFKPTGACPFDLSVFVLNFHDQLLKIQQFFLVHFTFSLPKHSSEIKLIISFVKKIMVQFFKTSVCPRHPFIPYLVAVCITRATFRMDLGACRWLCLHNDILDECLLPL